jgi:malonyl CoA-acyl carrier protein transacylase
MQQDCLECQRLWREYSGATNSHVALENRRRQAVRSGDTPSVEKLQKEVAFAAQNRESARQAIEQHEAQAHGAAANSANLES